MAVWQCKETVKGEGQKVKVEKDLFKNPLFTFAIYLFTFVF
jgi:hypothetical protein